MNLRAQVISGVRWSASVKLLSQIVTWGITLVVIRLLSPADYGLLAMATVFVQVAAMFSEFGLGQAVVQRKVVDETILRKTFGVVLLVHLSLTVALCAAAPLISDFYGEPRLTPLTQALSLQFVIGAFAVIPNALLQRQLEFRNRSLLDLATAIGTSLTTLALALNDAGVWALVLGSTLGQLLRSAGLNFLSPFVRWPDFSFSGMRSLLSFGGHVTTAQIFGVYISQIDIIICSKWLGNEMVGYYSTAMHLASMPTQRVSAIVNQVAFPAFASIQGDLSRVRSHLLLGAKMLGFFAFPLLWAVSSLSEEIVAVFLGAKWQAAALPLQVLALIMPVRLIGNTVHVAIQGIGRPDISLRNVVFASAIITIALLLGAAYGGLPGLCMGWLVASPLSNLQGLLRSLPAIGTRLREFGGALTPALAAAGMYGAVWLTRAALVDMQLTSLARLPVLVAVCAVSYGALSWTFFRPVTREVMGLVRNLAQR